MNLQKQTKLFLSGNSMSKSSRVGPGTPRPIRSKASTIVTLPRRSATSVGLRSSETKAATKSPGTDASRKFSSCGRSSDPRYGVAGTTSPNATLPEEVPKARERDLFLEAAEKICGAPGTVPALFRTPDTRELDERTRPTWNENCNSEFTDLEGGGEGRTEANEDDDDGFEDEEEENAHARNKMETLGVREAKRAEHCAMMEAIARSVPPLELENRLREKGFFTYNYNVHARTTMSKQNLKNGRKKGIERLMLLLTFA